MPEDPTRWWATKPVHHNYIKNTVSRRVWDLASLEKCSIQPTGTMSWPPPSSGPGPPCVQWASSAAGLSKLAFRWLEPSFLQIQTNFLGPFINNWLRHSYPQISLNNNKLKHFGGTSLVGQWLRTGLAMQGMWIQSLVEQLSPLTTATESMHSGDLVLQLGSLCTSEKSYMMRRRSWVPQPRPDAAKQIFLKSFCFMICLKSFPGKQMSFLMLPSRQLV